MAFGDRKQEPVNKQRPVPATSSIYRKGAISLFGMKAVYRNLRIKYKLIMLISIMMFVIGAITYAMQQYTFEAYDKELYMQSASALNNASLGIENELKRIEKLSFNLSTDSATDNSIQRYLSVIKQSDSSYDNFLYGNRLRDRILFLAGLDRYILSTQIIDAYGREYASGNKMITFTAERIRQIKAETAKEYGGITYIFPDYKDTALIAGREIRSINGLNLDYLGNVAIRINVDQLFRDFTNGVFNKDAHFAIMDGNRVVYSLNDSLPLEDVAVGLTGKRGFQIVTIADKKFFMTYVPSSYTSWNYVNLIPYNDIFKDIESAKRTVFFVYGLLYLLVILFALGFSRGITGPIERLNSKMKRVQLGHFDYVEEPGDRELSKDEAGQLHRNFRIMVQRIEELINENYIKQLAIKDTEFKALQAQINPHFLYNTLESINWSAKIAGQSQISLMVESLGFLLRSSISNKEPLITIKEELEIIGHYFTIQKIRFEERLEFEQSIPQELQHFLIPKLSLQPLVENAINYGLEQMTGTCRIAINAMIQGHFLYVTVSDNGPGIDAAMLEKLRSGEVKPKGTGIGLRNIDERIKLLFNDDYGIELVSQPGEGTTVKLRLPMKVREYDV
ncbi:sensor histidine kinase [Paenibacillus tarimensis]